MQGVQQQLQRIELLVKLEQYDEARMALREGSFKSLRMDLGYGQEMYRAVKPQVRVWRHAHIDWRAHNCSSSITSKLPLTAAQHLQCSLVTAICNTLRVARASLHNKQ